MTDFEIYYFVITGGYEFASKEELKALAAVDAEGSYEENDRRGIL